MWVWVWVWVALECGWASGEAGRAGETTMAGAAEAAAVGVHTVQLPARESKASGDQPGMAGRDSVWGSGSGGAAW